MECYYKILSDFLTDSRTYPDSHDLYSKAGPKTIAFDFKFIECIHLKEKKKKPVSSNEEELLLMSVLIKIFQDPQVLLL